MIGDAGRKRSLENSGPPLFILKWGSRCWVREGGVVGLEGINPVSGCAVGERQRGCEVAGIRTWTSTAS